MPDTRNSNSGNEPEKKDYKADDFDKEKNAADKAKKQNNADNAGAAANEEVMQEQKETD